MSAARPPPAVAANVPAESHISSVGAQSEPSLPQAFPGGREIPQKVFFPLAPPESLRATQSAVLMVDRVSDGEGVFIGEKSDVGLRLGQVVEHASVSDALAVGGDRACGKVRDETLAVAFVQTATAAAAAASVIHTAGIRMGRR